MLNQGVHSYRTVTAYKDVVGGKISIHMWIIYIKICVSPIPSVYISRSLDISLLSQLPFYLCYLVWIALSTLETPILEMLWTCCPFRNFQFNGTILSSIDFLQFCREKAILWLVALIRYLIQIPEQHIFWKCVG